MPISTDKKRKQAAERSDGNKTATTSKRIKTDGSSQEKGSTQDKEGSGKGAVGNSGPQSISMKHPVNIQNAIYAAERLSCAPDITHSLNFILRGEI
jgi:hypothetical protein